jgi:hypothetical protein
LWQVSAAIAAIFATPAKPGAEADPQIGEPTLQLDRPDPAYRAAAEAVLHRTTPLA